MISARARAARCGAVSARQILVRGQRVQRAAHLECLRVARMCILCALRELRELRHRFTHFLRCKTAEARLKSLSNSPARCQGIALLWDLGLENPIPEPLGCMQK